MVESITCMFYVVYGNLGYLWGDFVGDSANFCFADLTFFGNVFVAVKFSVNAPFRTASVLYRVEIYFW